ncbi:MAG: glucokinase [Desulfovibrio sp.]|jgi:glucokinase|nr:glucokinase [Desulfovibrio sp.]
MIRILAADIGATHCRFALIAAEVSDEDLPLLSIRRKRVFPGRAFPDCARALRSLFAPDADTQALLSHDEPVDAAVLAPAGPVLAQGDEAVCAMPNLPWVLRSDELRSLLGVPRVMLLNDLSAQAYACLLPAEADTVCALAGEAMSGAPLAVAAAGTGFGKALLLCESGYAGERKKERLDRMSRARVLPSEGGHAEFPFVGEEEFAFARFAARKKGGDRLIGDDIVSGIGLALIADYLTGAGAPPEQAAKMCADRPEILEWYARFYGRFCRNYVLDALALGGLYVSGGMALRVPVLDHPAFAEEFYAQTPPGHFLRSVPVWHMRAPEAGLFGAALYALLRLRVREKQPGGRG